MFDGLKKFALVRCSRCHGTGFEGGLKGAICRDVRVYCLRCNGDGVISRAAAFPLIAAAVAHLRAWYETTDPVRLPLDKGES